MLILSIVRIREYQVEQMEIEVLGNTLSLPDTIVFSTNFQILENLSRHLPILIKKKKVAIYQTVCDNWALFFSRLTLPQGTYSLL